MFEYEIYPYEQIKVSQINSLLKMVYMKKPK